MSVLEKFRLTGKRLFITGGSRGLGREMALACAEAGADCILVGREQATLDQACQEIRSMGRQAFAIEADVSRPELCAAACKSALMDYGPIDILINNAGGRRQNIPTEEMPLETWRELIDLNLTSTFVCTKVIGGAMVARAKAGELASGRIINIASINALVAGRKIAGRHYETSKAAVVQFTRATAADWAPFGVTVNAILPGGFMTDANKSWRDIHPEVIQTFQEQIPLGRYGEPHELGPLAVYLASEASSYMTGAALVIDGGYTLW